MITFAAPSRAEDQLSGPLRHFGKPKTAKVAAKKPMKTTLARVTSGSKMLHLPHHVPATVPPTSATSVNPWIKSVEEGTRTLRVYLDPGCVGPCAPYAETLVLAVDGQYVVVPWKFISDTAMTNPNVRLIVDNQDARLIDIDIASNVALLRTDQPLLPCLYRSQIRQTAPNSEEPLFAMTTRTQLSPDARFLTSKTDGQSQRYVIKAKEDQAQYFFDRSGNLVAMGSGPGASSSRAVYDLLRKQDGPQPASVSGRDQRRRQLYGLQDHWTQIIGPAKTTFSLSQLDCKPEIATVMDQHLAGKIHDAKLVSCENRISAPVESDYQAGVEVISGDITMRAPASDSDSKWSQAFGTDFFSDLNRDAAKVNLMTVPECHESSVTNSHSQQVQVKFCTSALKVEPGLNDTAVFLSTTDMTSHTHVVMARLRGFAANNTHRIVESLVENVGSLK